jgi:hypothetical protein
MKPGVVAYFAMEKRVNFCLDTNGRSFRSYARAYEHLMVHLNATKDEVDPWTQEIIPKSIWSYKEIPVTFLQYFEYTRSNDLVLLEMTIKNTN